MPNSGLQANMFLIYFIYGLAFFSMGLAMLLESGRSPLLAEGKVLRPLAFFGFLHGTHEWLEMFLENGETLGFNWPLQAGWFRIGILGLSFISLFAFGLQVLDSQRQLSAWEISAGIGFLGLMVFSMVVSGKYGGDPGVDWMRAVDILVRYILAVPGAALAAMALHMQSRQALGEERFSLALGLRWAAWSFALYSLTQVFVPAMDAFPTRYLNKELFLTLTGVPIQLVRAILAVTATVSLIRATQIVEADRQRQHMAAQRARLEALEQIQQELADREILRRHLLRHTVLAQEEERARIARELHDETAQVLTGFSLNLAALRDTLPKNPKAHELLERLQGLSRQMSNGIYRLVHDLRPAQLDDLGLVAALNYLGDQEFKRSGLKVSLEVNGPRQRLDSVVETVFFRVAQEALTNVARHANVNQASIALCYTPQQVILRVCDPGSGFDVHERPLPPRGWGLAGMQERCESIGGRFLLESSPGKGTVVEVSVSLMELAIGKEDAHA